LRATGKRLVVTNGCFDLCTLAMSLTWKPARNQGDALLVGVNGDEAVRELKGPDRPLNEEHDRAAVLAHWGAWTAFASSPNAPRRAFFQRRSRTFYVKGGDYTLATLNPDERRAVEQAGGRIVIIPFVPGKSATGLLQKMFATVSAWAKDKVAADVTDCVKDSKKRHWPDRYQ